MPPPLERSTGLPAKRTILAGTHRSVFLLLSFCFWGFFCISSAAPTANAAKCHREGDHPLLQREHTEINGNYTTYRQLPGKKVSLHTILLRFHVLRWAKGGMQVGQLKIIQLFILGSSTTLQGHSHALMLSSFIYFGYWIHYSSPKGRTPAQTPTRSKPQTKPAQRPGCCRPSLTPQLHTVITYLIVVH